MKMKQRILFVDDDRRRTEIFVEMLRMEGYEVTFAATIKEAQKEFQERTSDFDLMILDIMMPLEDYVGENTIESRKRGITFLQRIRQARGKNKLPVIIFTVRHDEETRKQAFDAGCNEYLEKPCLPSKLLKEVKENLAWKSKDAFSK